MQTRRCPTTKWSLPGAPCSAITSFTDFAGGGCTTSMLGAAPWITCAKSPSGLLRQLLQSARLSACGGRHHLIVAVGHRLHDLGPDDRASRPPGLSTTTARPRLGQLQARMRPTMSVRRRARAITMRTGLVVGLPSPPVQRTKPSSRGAPMRRGDPWHTARECPLLRHRVPRNDSPLVTLFLAKTLVLDRLVAVVRLPAVGRNIDLPPAPPATITMRSPGSR